MREVVQSHLKPEQSTELMFMKSIGDTIGANMWAKKDSLVWWEGNCFIGLGTWEYSWQKSMADCFSDKFPYLKKKNLNIDVTGLPSSLHVFMNKTGSNAEYCSFVTDFNGHYESSNWISFLGLLRTLDAGDISLQEGPLLPSQGKMHTTGKDKSGTPAAAEE